MKAGKVLQKIIEWYSENPEHWCQGYSAIAQDGSRIAGYQLYEERVNPSKIRSACLHGAGLLFFGIENSTLFDEGLSSTIMKFYPHTVHSYKSIIGRVINFNDSSIIHYMEVMNVLGQLLKDQDFYETDVENYSLGIMMRGILGRGPVLA